MPLFHTCFPELHEQRMDDKKLYISNFIADKYLWPVFGNRQFEKIRRKKYFVDWIIRHSVTLGLKYTDEFWFLCPEWAELYISVTNKQPL